MLAKQIIISFLVGCSCILFGAPAVGDAFDDFYIQQAAERYYDVPIDARSLGLGGAATTLCQGAACLLNNPAGHGFMRAAEIYADFGSTSLEGRDLLGGATVEQDTLLGSGVLAIPLGVEESGSEYGVVALGYSRYQGDTNDTLGTIPDGHRRSLAYGYAPSDTTSFGYGLTFYDDQLNTDTSDIHSHSRFLHLFGLQQKLSDRLSLGAVFRLGIGQSDTEDYQLGSDGLSRPREYALQLGLGYDLDRVTFFTAANVSVLHSRANLDRVSPGVFIGGEEEGVDSALSAGVEVKVTGLVRLRHGVRYRYVDYTFERDDVKDLTGHVSEFGVSGGIGITLPVREEGRPQPRIDYGIDYGSIGRGHLAQLLAFIVPF